MAVKVNAAGIDQIRSLIASGHVNTSAPWSFSAADGNSLLGAKTPHNWKAYGTVHLAEDTGAGAETRERYKFPVAKRDKGLVMVFVSGLRAAITRAAQSGDKDVEAAAQKLLDQAKGHKAAMSENLAIGVCSFELGQPGEALHLIPDGEFRSNDGRPKNAPHWKLSAALANDVIARAAARRNDIVLDFEHQTLMAAKNGQPAPAAGWFKQLEYRPGEGLFATDVRYTDRARDMIQGGEYKYASAVFKYRPGTGEVLEVLHAGVTNSPAIDGLNELEARAAAKFSIDNDEHEDQNMNPILVAVLKALGLGEDADEAAVVGAIDALKADVKTKGDEIAVLKKGGAGEPDPEKFVPIATFEELKGEVATLRAENLGRDIDELVEDALSDGRLLPQQETWARDLGKSNIASLKTYIEKAQPIAALKGKQTARHKVPADPDRELSEAELVVCKSLGLSEDEFKKGRKAQEESVAAA